MIDFGHIGWDKYSDELVELRHNLPTLIARATRKARREELEKLSWAVVESCEPECDAVRHARHEGTWNAHLIIEERLAELDSGRAKSE